MRRLRGEETGIALPLAMILIVVIGVMGAGLLVFVTTDLRSVAEVNRGQRAFEMADAGIQAARQQIEKEPGSSKYDGTGDGSEWSESGGGMELENLDDSPATDDSARVTIGYDGDNEEYTVISTGEYSGAKRRIEARFEHSGGGGLPAYYTPGSIRLEDDVRVNGVSMFAGRNIIVEPSGSTADFRDDYENSGDPLEIGDTEDPLGDWNRPPWNTVGREDYDGDKFKKPGFAAEGFICGSSSCEDSSDGVADGVYGYDSTTASEGNDLEFVDKSPPDKTPNDSGTITYPFPGPAPDAEYLKQLAEDQGNYVDLASRSLDWDELYPDADPGRVVFIDANGDESLSFETEDGSRNQGILVVRCGSLDMEQKFQGVIIVLKGQSQEHGSDCGDKAQYESTGVDVEGYVYAEGDNPSGAGIRLGPGSEVEPLPGGMENLLDLSRLVSGDVTIKSWRELYE